MTLQALRRFPRARTVVLIFTAVAAAGAPPVAQSPDAQLVASSFTGAEITCAGDVVRSVNAVLSAAGVGISVALGDVNVTVDKDTVVEPDETIVELSSMCACVCDWV